MAVRVPAGTEADNFVAEDTDGRQWFVKVYRDRNTIDQDQSAVDLAMFACAGGVPVPSVHRTIAGRVIGETQGMALSLLDYMAETTTAEDGLIGKRWENVGLVLGKLQRLLARYPSYRPSLRPATGIIDVARARFRFDKLIDDYQRLDSLSSDQQWARCILLCNAARCYRRHRRSSKVSHCWECKSCTVISPRRTC